MVSQIKWVWCHGGSGCGVMEEVGVVSQKKWVWCHRRSGCGVPMFHNCAHTSDLWTGQQDWLSGVADVPPSVQAVPRWFTSPLCPPPYQPSTASITVCGLCSLQGWSLMMEWVCLLQRATPLCPLSMLINAVHWWGGGGGGKCWVHHCFYCGSIHDRSPSQRHHTISDLYEFKYTCSL